MQKHTERVKCGKFSRPEQTRTVEGSEAGSDPFYLPRKLVSKGTAVIEVPRPFLLQAPPLEGSGPRTAKAGVTCPPGPSGPGYGFFLLHL